jgi:hypothetical protein
VFPEAKRAFQFTHTAVPDVAVFGVWADGHSKILDGIVAVKNRDTQCSPFLGMKA